MKKLFSKALFILATSASFAQVPTNGLVGYWPFDGNLNDQSGNSRNGVAIGTALYGTDITGASSKCLDYSQNLTYVSFNNSENLPLAGTQDWSISLYFKSKNGGRIAEKYTSSSTTLTHGYRFGISINNGDTTMTASMAFDSFINGGWDCLSGTCSSFPIFTKLNKWGHIAFVKKADTLYCYNDGKLANKRLFRWKDRPIGTQKMVLGYWPNIDNRDPYKGQFDDFAIYNRALTITEITQIASKIISNTCFQKIAVSDTLKIRTITGLNELPDDFGTIKIFPNPTNDVLNISVSNPSPNYTIKITNSTSQTLFTTQLTTSSYQLNLNTLGAKGLYFIQILDNTNKVLETKKLVLE